MSDPAGTLRRAREAAGLSLAAMAARTHYSKSYLGNVETGRRAVTPDVVRAYEQATGSDMERRGLLAGVAAGVVAATATSEVIRRGFIAAFDGDGDVDDWNGRVEGYGRDYMSLGASELQQRLAGDLVVIQRHLTGPAWWGVAARLMTVYGKTLPSTDAHTGAVSWYRMAATAADRSTDTAVRVWVRGRAALALGYEGAALPVARELADQALALSDRPSIGRLNALVAKAHVAALGGDRSGALGLLGQARRVFDVAGSTEQISDYAMPPWRMATTVSLLLSRLGDPGAEAAQQEADRTRPASLARFATHIELHRALMMARSGDVTGGIDYARTALDKLPQQRHSLSLRLLMAEVERTAPPPRR